MLNESILVNQLLIKNRLVMPPMATGKSNSNGSISEELCNYYDEKSLGGYIGLIITEHSYILQQGKASAGQMSMDENFDLEGIKKLTSIIHKNGSAVFCQLNHSGRRAKAEITGQYVVDVYTANRGQIVKAFADAAQRAKNGGYDGVEIHSAHGYLLNQFYSPLENRETELDKRINIHLDVIKAVREAVGIHYPIALRLGACDYMEGGSSIADAVYACKKFEEVGVDLLDISGGLCGYMRKDNDKPGWFSDASEAIKANVHIPVILTGGIVDRNQAEILLRENKADMIGVGRAILKDSKWAQKAMLEK